MITAGNRKVEIVVSLSFLGIWLYCCSSICHGPL